LPDFFADFFAAFFFVAIFDTSTKRVLWSCTLCLSLYEERRGDERMPK